MKKVIGLLLVTLVCAGVFVGCGSGTNADLTSEQQMETESNLVSTDSISQTSEQETVIDYTVNPEAANKNLTSEQSEIIVYAVKAVDLYLYNDTPKYAVYDRLLELVDQFKVDDSTPNDVSSVKTDMTMLYAAFSPNAQPQKDYILKYRNKLAAVVGLEER